MMSPGKGSTAAKLGVSAQHSQFAAEVFKGLNSTPRRLHPKWFYDARGSELFEQITRLPEYYLTRTEQGILCRFAADIIAAAGSGLTLVELGAGSATKTGLLIAALLRRQLTAEYVPIDVSRSALVGAAHRLRQEFPGIRVRPHVADFTAEFPRLAALHGRKLVLFIGSSIGNFEPGEAQELLRRVRSQLHAGDALLLGTDLVKSPEILVPAYADRQGVTAAFNKNVLARINRELGGTFDLSCFRHVALWNEAQSRMEMHLESTRRQRILIRALGAVVEFGPGERIHTESSYKYTQESAARLLCNSGFVPESTWTDDRRWFAVHLARVP